VSEHELIKRFMRSQSRYLGYLIAMTRDLDAAQEVLQDAAVVILQGARDPSIRDFDAWSKEVVRRQALRFIKERASSRAHVRPMAPALLDEVSRSFLDDPLSEEDCRDEGPALRSCVAKLPTRSRHLLSLRYEQRQSFDQIATAVESTSSEIQKALSRIRRALHDCVRGARMPAGEYGR
jgi:RNA polymerase sigma-70 factor (ECF subfamily)